MMKATHRASSYVIEAALAVGFVYLMLGGSKWSPLGWAAFCVLSVTIAVAEVLTTQIA